MSRQSPLRRGSAMLIAMLVVAIIGAVGFGVVRITIKQLRQQGSVANSTRAFMAAEAGLEYALLQYRLNKDAQLGEASPLSVSLSDDQSFTVVSKNKYERLGGLDCLTKGYLTAAAFLGCDGQGGRTLLRLTPGATARIAPAQNPTGGLYLFSRGRLLSDGNSSNAVVIITGFDASGQTVGQQQVHSLSGSTTNPILPVSGASAASGNLAAASWFTIRYLNDLSSESLVLAVGLSTSTDNPASGAVPFTTDRRVISAVGRSGGVSGVERQIQAIVNSRDNIIEGIYDNGSTALGSVDYVLSGQSLVMP